MPDKQPRDRGRRTIRGGTPRRTLIGEAALRILAREGARGLTHRAIDKELELPPGSTSHYCRTRLELLKATYERQVEMDLADAGWMNELGAGDDLEKNTALLADRLTAMFATWLSPQNRWRTLARNELFLGATREAALDAILSEGTAQFIARQTEMLGRLGSKEPERAARQLLLLGTGVLFSQVTTTPAPGDQPMLDQIVKAAVRQILGA